MKKLLASFVLLGVALAPVSFSVFPDSDLQSPKVPQTEKPQEDKPLEPSFEYSSLIVKTSVDLETLGDHLGEYELQVLDEELGFVLVTNTDGRAFTEATKSEIESLEIIESVDWNQRLEGVSSIPGALSRNLDPTADFYNWALDATDQKGPPLDDKFESTLDGSGVDVYVIDGGVNVNHQEFGSRSATGFSAHPTDGPTVDCDGHGTHVAGSAVGSNVGPATGATIIPVKVSVVLGSRDFCSGSLSSLIEGLEWIRTNASGPSVANMSLRMFANSSVDAAAQALIDSGVVLVVASGNNNSSSCTYSPHRLPDTITVNAYGLEDNGSGLQETRFSNSNFGSCTDIYAPGVDVVSADFEDTTGYRTLTGTSMAAPIVAGVAALLFQAEPSATPAAIWERMASLSRDSDFKPGDPSDAKRTLYYDQAELDGPCAVDVKDSSGNVIAVQQGVLEVGQDGDDCVVQFKDTSVDYRWNAPDRLQEVWVLAVGGGGEGGTDDGGGGGAGEFVEIETYDLTADTDFGADGILNIAVGAGGAASGPSDVTSASNGESSTFGDLTAIGGGGGGHGDNSTASLRDGRDGGSGGGAAGENRTGKSPGVSTASTGLGNPGGGAESSNRGGGGGGAGEPGNTDGQGHGGDGLQSAITGTATHYAGGGGAGGLVNETTVPGGLGGGGTGGGQDTGSSSNKSDGNLVCPTAGEPNTGGGGGGNGSIDQFESFQEVDPPCNIPGDTSVGATAYLQGMPGGSGVVIVRFAAPVTFVTIDNNCDAVGSPNGVASDKVGGECIVEFRRTNTEFEVSLPATVAFSYLAVAGGGGGAGSWSEFISAGGGGGGEVLEGNQSVAVDSITVKVGSGGSGGLNPTLASSRGSDGSKTTVTPKGETAIQADEGKGAPPPAGTDTNNDSSGGPGGASGSGNSGGTGVNASSGVYHAAGGGGDSSAGSNTNFGGGDGSGGAGTTPSSINLLAGSPASFGGGGGGASAHDSVTAGTASDGGGDGGQKTAGSNGATNTGGGGGGGATNSVGGDGADGFVALNFSLPFAQLEFSAPVSTDGGYKFTVENYDELLTASGGPITWSFSGTAGSASINDTVGDANEGLITVTGLADATSDTLTVTASPTSGGDASRSITGNSLAAQSSLSFSLSGMKYLESQFLSATGGDGVGAVSFSGTAGVCEVSGSTLNAVGVGSCTVTATKAADNVYKQKTASDSITVGKGERLLAFDSAVPSDPTSGDQYTPTVSIVDADGQTISDATATFTIDSSNTDTFTDPSDSQTKAVCSVSSGVVSLKAAGSCYLDAISDNTLTLFDDSNTDTQIIQIGIANQNIRFEAIANKSLTDAPFTLSPTSSAGLNVALSESSSACSLNGSAAAGYTLTLDAVGSCSITATQPGLAGQVAAASPITRSFQVEAVVPGPPILESVGFDSQTINLSFSPPSFTGGVSILGYELTATDSFGNSFTNNNCSSSPCSVTGLENGVEYITTIKAVNQAGASSEATAPIMKPATAADSVSNLYLENGDQEIVANWTAPTSFGGGTFASYELTLLSGTTVIDTASIGNQATTTKTFTGLSNGTQYDLEVVVLSTANTEELTSNTARTQGIPGTVPGVVRNITAEIESFDKAFISWVEPDTDGGLDITGYRLNTGTDSTSTDTFRELTGLPGGDVEITIVAVNDIGDSAIATFTLNLPNAPSGGGASSSFTGPLIESVEPNPDSEFGDAGREILIVKGLRLSGVTKAVIDGKELEIVSVKEDSIELVMPNGLADGTYDLQIESSLGNLTYLDALVIGEQSVNAVSYGEMSSWTKRISDTQVKVYVKFPTVGEKVRITHQTGGSGSYETVYVKTTSSETMEGLRIVEGVGTYIVRTIDLASINRIRVTVGDEELVQVRYNN